MLRPAPPTAAPGRRREPAAAGARCRRSCARAGLVALLALALAPGAAAGQGPASGPGPDAELSPGTGEPEGEADASPPAKVDAPAPAASVPADAAAGWIARAQQQRAQGELDGAIESWQRALAALPVTQATAYRRAGLALAIAAAHAEAAQQRGAPERLRAALAVLDAYLAALDPTDDENRVAVEQYRADLAARVVAPRPDVGRPRPRTRPDRRLVIAGGVGLGLGVAGLVTMGAGLLAGERADAELAEAIALAGDDPSREAQKAGALARGQRANRSATVGAAVGAALLVLGAALLAAGLIRRVPARTARARWLPRAAAGGLRWSF